MSKSLSNESSLENLRREAKRWLRALRSNDEPALARLRSAHPSSSAHASLRDVQHALAREYGFASWAQLGDAVTIIEQARLQRLHDSARDATRDDLLPAFLSAVAEGAVGRVVQMLAANPELINERGAVRGYAGEVSALRIAMAAPNSYELVHLLLDKGANPNIRDEFENITLAEKENVAVVEEFSDEGADDDREVEWDHARVTDSSVAVVEVSREFEHDSVRKNRGENVELISRFLSYACRDWRDSGGGGDIPMKLYAASRLLEQHPELPRANILTASVCGDAVRVRELLQEDASLANVRGGPRDWPPLLYLASARLLQPMPAQNAETVARVLLEFGADPNAYYADGSGIPGASDEGNHFTVLTCLLGRGEQQIAPHSDVRRLVALLLDHGADPHDLQALYNIFADHGSRRHLSGDIVWLLELMYQHAVRRGQVAQWNDPAWTMFTMGAHGQGAYFLLKSALDAKLLSLAEWMMQHGADPNTRPANSWRAPYTLFEQAFRSGDKDAQQLLKRYGASDVAYVSWNAYESFVEDCLNGNAERAREQIALHPEWLKVPHALIAATRKDNADAVALLLSLGVSPDVEEARGGGRALHAACFAGATRAAKVLLNAGADADAPERNYGATPMSIASWAQQPAMTDALAPFSKDIFSLVFAGKVQRVRALLDESPSIAGMRNAKGESLLMRLPDNEDDALSIAVMLVANGADVSLRAPTGETAREQLEHRAMVRVAEELARHEASSVKREAGP